MAGGVYISYRREDSAGFARLIYDRLTTRLEPYELFRLRQYPTWPRFRRGSD
jgi:hypothetical protein